jgi:hypothetical protein
MSVATLNETAASGNKSGDIAFKGTCNILRKSISDQNILSILPAKLM